MNNNLNLTIHTSGDAFNDEDGGDTKARRELARLLRKVADQIEEGWSQREVVDSNGNTCGEWGW